MDKILTREEFEQEDIWDNCKDSHAALLAQNQKMREAITDLLDSATYYGIKNFTEWEERARALLTTEEPKND